MKLFIGFRKHRIILRIFYKTEVTTIYNTQLVNNDVMKMSIVDNLAMYVELYTISTDTIWHNSLCNTNPLDVRLCGLADFHSSHDQTSCVCSGHPFWLTAAPTKRNPEKRGEVTKMPKEKFWLEIRQI